MKFIGKLRNKIHNNVFCTFSKGSISGRFKDTMFRARCHHRTVSPNSERSWEQHASTSKSCHRFIYIQNRKQFLINLKYIKEQKILLYNLLA